MKKTKLQSKDLIVAGAFAAMYLVLLMVGVSVLGVIPLLYLAAPFFISIILGPVYMLYVAKIPKRGAILILGILVGLLTSMGGVWQAAVWAIVLALIAEVIVAGGQYKSKRSYLISYIIFACSNMGPFWMLVFAKQSFLDSCAIYYGAEYAASLDALTPIWIVFVLIGIALIGGTIGGLFGRKLVNKHFKKAGVI